MRNYIIIASMMYLNMQLSAMDTQIVDAKSIAPIQNPDIFPLVHLPPEIQNCIAQFLPFKDRETDEEFIERTRVPKTVPFRYYAKFLKPYQQGKAGGEVRSELCTDTKSLCAVFCPDQTKIGVLKINHRYFNELVSKLTIFDLKEQKTIYIAKQVQEMEYEIQSPLVAVSRSGNIFAIIEKRLDNTPSSCDVLRYKDMLLVKNIATEKTQEIAVPMPFYQIDTLGFNKQDTKIIVHGIDLRQLHRNSSAYDRAGKKALHHLIFPLKSYIQENNSGIGEKTLIEYFKQRGVCNQVTAYH